jgi:hypothetical protein
MAQAMMRPSEPLFAPRRQPTSLLAKIESPGAGPIPNLPKAGFVVRPAQQAHDFGKLGPRMGRVFPNKSVR